MIAKRADFRMVLLLFVAVFLIFGTLGCEGKPKGSIPVSGKNTSDFPDMAKVSMTDALNKAMEKYPGKAIKVELEEEEGYLVYKVAIVGADKAIMKLDVDAGNGSILDLRRKKDEKN